MNENNGKSSDAIKADIERTRNEMSERIDTLQERLNPDTLKAQAQDMIQEFVQESADALLNYVSSSAQQAGRSTMEMIKRNPLPAAVVGAGIGWLLLNMFKSQRSDSGNYGGNYYGGNYQGRNYQGGNYQGGNYQGNRFGAGDPMRSQSAMGAGMSSYGYDDRNAGGYGYEAWDETTIYYSDDSMNNQFAGQYGGQYGNQGGQGMVDKMRSGAQDAAGRVGDTAQNVAGKVQDTAQDVAGKVQDTAQGVAGKVADAAQGIVGKVQDAAQGIAGKVQDTAGSAAQPIGDMGHQVRHQAMGAGRQVQRQAGNLTAQTQQQAQRMGVQAQRTIEDNPIAFGAAALVAGIAVGLALPATRQERQLLGDVRDQVMDKAQTVATGIAEDLKQVVNEAKPRLQETAQRVTEDLKQSGMQATEDVKQTLQDATSTAKSRVGEHLSLGSEGQEQSGSESSSASGKSGGKSKKSGGKSDDFQSESATIGSRQMSDYTADWQAGQEHHPDDVDSTANAEGSEPKIASGTIADQTSDDREE